ncbi:MAG: peptide chain release factor 2 [Proteobacteria bacterium]|nr:peptide chain release factor 2 [Pseudomonadota bacterium]
MDKDSPAALGSPSTGGIIPALIIESITESPQWKQNASTPSPTRCPSSSFGIRTCGGIFDYDNKAEKLIEVSTQLEDPAVWNEPKRAQDLGREKKELEGVVHTLDSVRAMLADCADMFELAAAEDDEETFASVEADVDEVEKRVAQLEFRRMFNNPMDPQPAFIEIQSGAGGTEAQDWAQMLERMYLRYCERKGFQVELMEESEGDVAGIKSATIKITGEYAYGYLRTETGVHRLVRKSPFDSNARRHTSFVSVFVYPEVDDSIEIDINPADVRTDTYRASGAGGQHINKTDSAVRLTHVPTNIVVQCQNDRSQHRNRDEAWKMLRARLFELELRKRQAEQQKLEDAKSDIGWGHQIRSYVLDQSRIKDLRTNYEVGNTQGVLDGDLDDFIQASLKQGV